MDHYIRRNMFSLGLPCLIFAVMTLCVANALRAEVSQGMRREEIVAAWGKPGASLTKGNQEFISYRDGREVHLVDGVAQSVLNPNAIKVQTEPKPDSPKPSSLPQVSPELREQLSVQISALALPDLSQSRLYRMAQVNMITGWPVIVLQVFVVFLGLLPIIAIWKMFTAAGEPGWAVLVPIYGTIVWLRVADKPAWWLLLFCLPVVNFLALLFVSIGVARNFGHGVGFGWGLFLLPVLFYPILAFGDSNYSPV